MIEVFFYCAACGLYKKMRVRFRRPGETMASWSRHNAEALGPLHSLLSPVCTNKFVHVVLPDPVGWDRRLWWTEAGALQAK